MTTTETTEELDWNTNDETGATTFDEEAGVLLTTLDDGVVIGWDICGCGVHVTTCGCDPIKLPRHVVKLQRAAATVNEPLEAFESYEETESVPSTTADESAAPEGSETVEKKTAKRPRGKQ